MILGQPNEFGCVYSTPSSVIPTLTNLVVSASNVTPTPTSLAWDGKNLYVADATDYRILVFTPGRADVPITGIVNAASRAIFALGSVVIGGTITEGNTVTVTLNGTGYTYKVVAKDTVDSVAKALTDVINAANSGAGDTSAGAIDESGFATILLVARQPGVLGNNITIATSVSANATITATASASYPDGGRERGHSRGGNADHHLRFKPGRVHRRCGSIPAATSLGTGQRAGVFRWHAGASAPGFTHADQRGDPL